MKFASPVAHSWGRCKGTAPSYLSSLALPLSRPHLTSPRAPRWARPVPPARAAGADPGGAGPASASPPAQVFQARVRARGRRPGGEQELPPFFRVACRRGRRCGSASSRARAEEAMGANPASPGPFSGDSGVLAGDGELRAPASARRPLPSPTTSLNPSWAATSFPELLFLQGARGQLPRRCMRQYARPLRTF
jgi:hypothetical protein